MEECEECKARITDDRHHRPDTNAPATGQYLVNTRKSIEKPTLSVGCERN